MRHVRRAPRSLLLLCLACLLASAFLLSPAVAAYSLKAINRIGEKHRIHIMRQQTFQRDSKYRPKLLPILPYIFTVSDFKNAVVKLRIKLIRLFMHGGNKL